MRIHVTGNAGAGKTTLCRELALQFQLPLRHLDSVVWTSNWEKPESEIRDEAVRSMCEGEAWIIDGVSEVVREQADYIIFLDTPRSTCLYRCIKRCFQWGFSTRPELPEDCPEIKILFRAIKLVWWFSNTHRKQLLLESESDSRFIVCRDSKCAHTKLEHLLAAA